MRNTHLIAASSWQGFPASRHWLIGLFLLTLTALPAPAALNVFLKIPGVTGQSQHPLHPQEIDVLSWSWGLSNKGTPQFEDLSIIKFLDTSSPQLLNAISTGQPFTNAVFSIVPNGATQSLYRIVLTNVRVTELRMGGFPGDDRSTESVQFGYDTFKMYYVAGSPDTSTNVRLGMYWDIPQQTGNLVTGTMDRTTAFVASLSFSAGAQQATISWPSIPGKLYQLSFTEDLTQPFIPFNTYPAGSAQTMAILVPISKAKGFFRVEELGE